MIRHFFSRQFIVYLLAGGGAAAANFATGALVRFAWSSPAAYGASVVLGMIVGTFASFFLHRRYTFAVADQPARAQALRYVVVWAGAVVLSLTFAEGLIGLWGLAGAPLVTRALAESIAHALTIALNTCYGFLAMKFFALRDPKGTP